MLLERAEGPRTSNRSALNAQRSVGTASSPGNRLLTSAATVRYTCYRSVTFNIVVSCYSHFVPDREHFPCNPLPMSIMLPYGNITAAS